MPYRHKLHSWRRVSYDERDFEFLLFLLLGNVFVLKFLRNQAGKSGTAGLILVCVAAEMGSRNFDWRWCEWKSSVSCDGDSDNER